MTRLQAAGIVTNIRTVSIVIRTRGVGTVTRQPAACIVPRLRAVGTFTRLQAAGIVPRLKAVGIVTRPRTVDTVTRLRAVGLMTRLQAEKPSNLVRFPVRTRAPTVVLMSRPGLSSSASYTVYNERTFPRVKQPGPANHLPPYIAEIKVNGDIIPFPNISLRRTQGQIYRHP